MTRSSTLLPVVLAMTAIVPAAQSSAPVAFRLDSQGSILVPVQIAGGEPILFVLDTGSSRSAISQRVAARLGATVVGQSEVISSGRPAVRPLVRLPTLTVKHMQKSGLLATVLDSSELRAIAGRADGILGMDFLGHHRYTLDYRNKLLLWDGSSVAGSRNSVQLQARWSEGRCLVALPQKAGGRPLWLLADSGADTLVLFRQRGVLRTVPLGQWATLDTAGGRLFVNRLLVPELKLGELRLRNLPAVELPVNRDRSAGDGLLPLRLFAQVYFDPASNSMTIVPR